jgi:hypothetical protein
MLVTGKNSDYNNFVSEPIFSKEKILQAHSGLFDCPFLLFLPHKAAGINAAAKTEH